MYYTTSTTSHALDPGLVRNLINYPVMFAAVGLVSCVVGILFLIGRNVSEHPHRELNYAVWVSAGLTLISNGIMTNMLFRDYDTSSLGFRVGAMSPWLAAVFGILAGIIIGYLAEYYTSYDFLPTKKIAKASLQGTALTITQGLSAGMKSTFYPVIVLAVATLCANYFAGLFGVAMAAIGMLSFVAATVSVDTYGPIADNAGGISEMSKLDKNVRKITDKLDSVGNTTAAIGKGFAIGSAALAALSLLASYMYSQANPGDTSGFTLSLNMINTYTLAGALVGAALPYYFSGLLIEAVAKAARSMVEEVRRQFKLYPGIMDGSQKPDYAQCIEISSTGALKEMTGPALISVFVPIVSGFVLESSLSVDS